MLSKMSKSLAPSLELAGSPHIRRGYAQLDPNSNGIFAFPDNENEKLTSMEEKNQMNTNFVEPKEPHCCITFCGVFSLTGFIFLLMIGCIIASDSIYIRVSPPKGKKGSSLAASIFVAATLYLICCGLCFYLHARALQVRKAYELSSQIHEDIN